MTQTHRPERSERPERPERSEAVGRPAATRSTAILVYLLLLVSLQVFLLVVAIEGLQGDEPALARNAALLSIGLFASTIALRWFVGDR